MGTPGGAGGGIWLGPPDRNDIRDVLKVQAAPGPLGEGGTFYIDPDRAEECIQALRSVAVELLDSEALLEQAYFPPPGSDQVSVNVAKQAGVMANRAAGYIASWRSQLEQTILVLEQQLADYLGIEQVNRDRVL